MTRYEIGVVKVAKAHGVDASSLMRKIAERDHLAGAATGALVGGAAGTAAGAPVAGAVGFSNRIPFADRLGKAFDAGKKGSKSLGSIIGEMLGKADPATRAATSARKLRADKGMAMALAKKLDKIHLSGRKGAVKAILATALGLGTAGGAAIGGLVGKKK